MDYNSDLQVDWLVDEFKKIRSTNQAYSLRAFARKLSISPSFLSQVFQGKKSLSEKMRYQIFEKLDFNDPKINIIEEIILVHQENINDVKSFCDQLCKVKVSDHINKKYIDAERYLPLIEWYHDAIFHFLDKKNKPKTIHDISSELDIPEEKLIAAVKRLEENNLIHKNDDHTYSKDYDSYCYHGDVHSRNLDEIKTGFMNNQKLILEKLLKKIDQGDASLTHLTTTYINIPEDKIPSAFNMIELFIKDLEKMYSATTETKEKLFCLNTQFLSLNKDA